MVLNIPITWIYYYVFTMKPKVYNYFFYKVLKIGYDHAYTNLIINFLKEMIILLIIEMAAVFIIKIYFPNFIKIAYALYNYLNMWKTIKFFRFIRKSETSTNNILIILFIRIFINNIYFDLMIIIGLVIYFYSKKTNVYFMCKYLCKVVVSNLNRKMRLLVMVYILLYCIGLY